MNQRPTFQDFVDDELLRAPLSFDQVVDAVLEQWRLVRPAGVRIDSDPVRVVSNHRQELVSAAVKELRGRVQSEISGTSGRMQRPGGNAPAKLELALIDEDEVSIDVEVSRAVERVKSAAEFEIRELQAFTSALVDDLNVARDTNPFRPECWVRSLWQGIVILPISRPAQAAFMRDAAEPLAKTLRQGYAAACSRLDAQGIVPAAHRTIVLTAATRPGQDWQDPSPGPDHLTDLRDSMPMPMPLDEAPPAQVKADIPHASAGIDPQLVELLSRLFDAIHLDPQVSPEVATLLLRLQPTALRVAVRDPSMLEDYGHPVWRFMDQLAFMMHTVPAADAPRGHEHARQLVEHLATDTHINAGRFEWASSRLAAFDRHLLDQGIASAESVILRIQADINSANAPLDVGTLDTVPAELLDDLPIPAKPPARPLSLQLGDRMRAYIHGDWRLLQLLWCDAAADHWLLREIATGQSWVLRRRALDRLVAEHLALPFKQRSLVRNAAKRVLRSVQPPQA